MFCAHFGHKPSLKRIVSHPSNISFKADGFAAA
jgi:hypothetical protein